MGRSVSYPSNCAIVVYAAFECMDEDDASFYWDDYLDELREQMQFIAPSMEEHDGWAGREDRILMRNNLAEFGVSEYCGLVAIWLRVRTDLDSEALAINWCATIAAKFSRAFAQLQKTGTASNGESFFQWINGHGPASRAEPLLDRG